MPGQTPRDRLRSDVHRALTLLDGGMWVRVAARAGEPERAGVQLSKYAADQLPIGLDVLEIMRAARYVVPGRRLPGGDRRFDMTAAGRAALAAWS